MHEIPLHTQDEAMHTGAPDFPLVATSTPHAMAWWYRMYCQESAVQFENDGVKWILTWQPVQTEEVIAQEWVDCKTIHASIGISVASNGFFHDFDLDNLEPHIRLNPWVLVHANLLDALTTSLGLAFTPFVLMTTFLDSWASRTRLSFKLMSLEKGETLHGNVFIDERLPSPGTRPQQNIQNEDFDLLPFYFYRDLGYRNITTADYRRLTPFGGIILNSYDPADSTQIWYGNGLQIRLKPSNDQAYSVLSILNSNQPSRSGVSPLNSFLPDTPASDLMNLDELPVTLTFVSAELSLTLQQLRRLQPGAPIELPAQADPHQVRILANGIQVGRGQLLRVGESLVVQVIQMAGNMHV